MNVNCYTKFICVPRGHDSVFSSDFTIGLPVDSTNLAQAFEMVWKAQIAKRTPKIDKRKHEISKEYYPVFNDSVCSFSGLSMTYSNIGAGALALLTPALLRACPVAVAPAPPGAASASSPLPRAALAGASSGAVQFTGDFQGHFSSRRKELPPNRKTKFFDVSTQIPTQPIHFG